MLFVLAHVANLSGENIEYSIIDFGDNQEPSEEKTSENQLKEHKISTSQLIAIEGLYQCKCLKYEQYNFDNTIEVFLEVITPPPEAS